jgi:chemotaxis protein histidine kinase CheA
MSQSPQELDEYRARQKRIFDLMRGGQPSPATTPGFAGGTLQDQLSRSTQQQQPLINPARIGPAPIEDPGAPPVAGTPQYEQAMASAYPVSASATTTAGTNGNNQPPPPRLQLGSRGFSGDESLVKLQTLRNSPLPEYGHAKGAGYGALAGIAANQGGTLGEKLGGGLAGLIAGGIKPNIAASIKRDYEIKAATQQAQQDQSLAQEQAQTEGMLAQPEIQRQRIEQQQKEAEQQTTYRNQQLEQQQTQQQAAAERALADREERKLLRQETERHHREDERLRGREKPSKSSTKSTDTSGKYRAAQSELDSLAQEEKAAQSEKDRAYKYLADLKASTTATDKDIAQAEKEAQAKDIYYQSFADKKRQAQAKLQENYVEPESEVNTDLVDPQIKAYADKFFKGNYAAAQAAIEKQRKGGQ